MSTSKDSTARLLLSRIPGPDRVSFVRDIAKSLDARDESADLDLAATLIQIQPDNVAQARILDYLDGLVQEGEHGKVVRVSTHYPALGSMVLQQCLSSLAAIAGMLLAQPRKWIAVLPRGAMISGPGASQAQEETDETADTDVVAKAVQLLRYVAQASSNNTDNDVHVAMFELCVFFIGSKDSELVKASQHCLFSLLATQGVLQERHINTLWDRIQDLIKSDSLVHKTVAYIIWLRWLSAEHALSGPILQQSFYWDLIIAGLQFGDTERRKASLQILRASINEVSTTPSILASLRTFDARSLEAPHALKQQTTRFCTIFETIVFGRYLNQVQECEADLDFLGSPESLLKPIWLYTLLITALDNKMQESSRKFIGTWIMRTKPKLDDPEIFLEFFQRAFIPWSTGGNLFTSSLREVDGILHCRHGDSLATFVRDLILNFSHVGGKIIDAILDTLLARYGNNFAYSMVYLIHGIGLALDSSPASAADPGQVDKLLRITGWTGFPEVARDYILARAWKISHSQMDASDPESQSSLWAKLQAKAISLKPGASAHLAGDVASLAMEPSKRELYEQKVITQCRSMMSRLDSKDVMSEDVSLEAMEEVWNDLDYLEYPKSLLMTMPALLAHPNLIQAAQDDGVQDTELAAFIATKIYKLAELSQSRSYLLTPLIRAIRTVVLSNHQAASLLRLEDLILHVTDHPSAPTVDARLEDATSALLTTLGPSMEVLNYEYYFGLRERHGFAALLDIVSCLNCINCDINSRLFRLLLDRWREQKTPPPSVSHWKTTLQLQVMLLCCEQHTGKVDLSQASSILKDLQYILAIEPLPAYRYLLEWMIARVYIRQPDLRTGLLDELSTKDHHSNPKFLAALMKLGVMLAKTDTSDEAFAMQLATVLVPLAASSKVIIRHEAQWQVPILMDHASAKGWTSISESMAFQALDQFIRSLERFDDPPLERQIDKLDPIKDHNLTHLVEGSWYDLDTVEQRQTNRGAFVALQELDMEAGLARPKPCMLLGDSIPSHSPQPDSTSSLRIDHDRKLLQNIDNISRALGSGPVAPTALQTKGTSYLENARPRHEHLLVVASLIDNPYNLGGLSRVSEIFGAGALYLPTPSIPTSKDFLSVSVSSHLHFPILPLPPALGTLLLFLAEKKRVEGYKVVGIEQTDRSVLLGSEECKLPEKCILVLGSEREGIPASVLGECDLLVEIPQMGITRSLNVQTAAGIVLFEYGRQWKK